MTPDDRDVSLGARIQFTPAGMDRDSRVGTVFEVTDQDTPDVTYYVIDTDGERYQLGPGAIDRVLPSEVHRSPKNDKGHLTTTHRHLLSLTPDSFDARDWSKITAAYRLIREVNEAEYRTEPLLMEDWDDRAPRRYRCDFCSAIFLTRNPRDDPLRKRWETSTPSGCPFCRYGNAELVEGWPEADPDSDSDSDLDKEGDDE